MDERGTARGDRAPDSIAVFAADLRALKNQYPKTSYEMMERRLRRRGIDIGRSTLNNAIKPTTLATERTIRAFVLALGEDQATPDRWAARRNTLTPPLETGPGTEPEPAVPTPRPAGRSQLRFVAAVAVLIATNTVTAVLVRACTPSPVTDSVARTDPPPVVQTGADPGKTHCRLDAKVAAGNNAKPQMLLEILFSHTCDAAWARITRYDNAGLGNRLEVSIYRRSDPHGPTRQDAVEPDVDSAYTTLIVRVDPTDRLCATGAVATAGHLEPISTEICT
ncbi:DUF2690 domain-containing protein [Nocardia fluminea]|uniref:DUF2690 domain-containing protein n=1 Tax=Nocardia fluminea TaxID=134984 RepID=UPI0036488FB4